MKMYSTSGTFAGNGLNVWMQLTLDIREIKVQLYQLPVVQKLDK